MNKKALKKFLYDVSSPEEIAMLEKLTEKEEAGGNYSEKTLALLSSVSQSLKNQSMSSPKQMEKVATAFADVANQLSKKFDELKEAGFNSEKLTVPLYKSMINSISGVQKAIVEKPTPVWRWPQYASVSVRNRNFSNIDPSVDSMNLGEYDSVAVTYPDSVTETYNFFQGGLSGTNTGTVTITYTDDTKAFVSSVVKVPVVLISA